MLGTGGKMLMRWSALVRFMQLKSQRTPAILLRSSSHAGWALGLAMI